jgi:hypothetical protein
MWVEGGRGPGGRDCAGGEGLQRRGLVSALQQRGDGRSAHLLLIRRSEPESACGYAGGRVAMERVCEHIATLMGQEEPHT